MKLVFRQDISSAAWYRSAKEPGPLHGWKSEWPGKNHTADGSLSGFGPIAPTTNTADLSVQTEKKRDRCRFVNDVLQIKGSE